MGQTFASSLLDIDPNKPFCAACQDTYYLLDRSGIARPCPFCHCSHCGRLKSAHPEHNGCDCHAQEQKKGKQK